ncbi:anti-sigma factor [Nesterenkonia sp. AN1]|uniref:Anti-sigma-K factor rskA n=1 Tax=Nesterenkonia aurantiaca TaxID=1436010 RepID=A0A4R7G3H3_9MICC|nr:MULTISPECIES: anti-sigma factor [Nesterenkonia]EXF25137.1 anti-sigma factor [Nesterenkonia sp. AN1]TDS85688.1 anti-sigma-K factor rskA [Nesterenkonia aurantiaca]
MTEQIPPRNVSSSDGHLTDEHLAILADPRLGRTETTAEQAHQPPPFAQREHLTLCGPCRAAFEATERALEALRDPAALHDPPAELWDRIAAGIAAISEETRVPGQSASDRDRPMDDHPARDRPMASVTELGPRQRRRAGTEERPPRRLWIPLAAAAAGAVLGGAAVAALLAQNDAAEVQAPVAVTTVVGDATLEPVAAEDFTGRAEMVETEAGDLELTVEISAAPDPEAGYFEVWLRDAEGTQLISLGSATAGATTFTVPAGIDLSQYPVVDVSHEHFDGDPTHSGTTLGAGPMEDPDS